MSFCQNNANESAKEGSPTAKAMDESAETESAVTSLANSTDGGNNIAVGNVLLTPVILLVVGLLLYLPWLGSYGPLDPTDSFFIESGRELFETNQYLLPLQNYKPWLDKPILYFWSVAGSYHLLGVNPFAGRLVSALSGVLLGLSTYFFSMPYISKKEAIVAALIFMSFPLASAIGHVSLTDMPLAALMATALFALFHFEKSRRKSACLVAYFALALAFLCKGPIAVIIVGAIYGLYLLLTNRPSTLLRKILDARPFLGLALIAVVNLPWYTMATIGTNGAFFQDFFITQNFGRMVGTVNHQQPFWFYIPVALGGLFPWSLVALLAAVAAFTKVTENKAQIASLIKNREQLNDRTAYLFFMAIWAVFVLVLFSAIKTKLPTYILPGLPPIAVLVAALLAFFENKDQAGGEKPSKVLITSAAIICATTIGAFTAGNSGHGWVKLFLTDARPVLIGAFVAALCYLFLALRNQRQQALAVLTALTVGLTALLVPMANIAFYKERQRPFEELIQRIQAAHADIATVIVEAPSLSYFLHRRVEALRDPAEAAKYLAGGTKPHWLLVPREVMESLKWFQVEPKLIAKTKNGKWSLYSLE
jgi:4-amino-4-deoxy-L-arabinose transferase-like glycosyltransferase